jgi:NAD-dependent DNA ligase
VSGVFNSSEEIEKLKIMEEKIGSSISAKTSYVVAGITWILS